MITAAWAAGILLALWLAHGAVLYVWGLTHPEGALVPWLCWFGAPLPGLVDVSFRFLYAYIMQNTDRLRPGLLVPHPTGTGTLRLVGPVYCRAGYLAARTLPQYYVWRAVYVARDWFGRSLWYPAERLYRCHEAARDLQSRLKLRRRRRTMARRDLRMSQTFDTGPWEE